MRVCDLDVLQYTLGNSLDFLFIRIKGVRTRRWPFCRAMTNAIETASRVFGQEKSPTQYGMFRPVKSKQPCLKCKAAHPRHMLPVTLFISEKLCIQGDNLGVLHLQMLTHCNAMYNDLYEWKDTGS